MSRHGKDFVKKLDVSVCKMGDIQWEMSDEEKEIENDVWNYVENCLDSDFWGR